MREHGKRKSDLSSPRMGSHFWGAMLETDRYDYMCSINIANLILRGANALLESIKLLPNDFVIWLKSLPCLAFSSPCLSGLHGLWVARRYNGACPPTVASSFITFPLFHLPLHDGSDILLLLSHIRELK